MLSYHNYSKVRLTSNLLKVWFPFSVLKETPLLIDPTNTETVYEYYLLENLAIGLVRDDPSQAMGYRPVLAESWERLNSKTWSFKIRKNLKWSDGSKISLKTIVQHFQMLSKRNSRHIQYLKKLDKILVNEAEELITFKFKTQINDGFLHELSLADAVLTHPKNITKDWTVTSGPYFVKEYNPKNKTLILQSNSHCMLGAPKMPKTVLLFGLNDLSEIPLLFKKIETDIFLVGTSSFSSRYLPVFKNAPRVKEGVPNFLFYFKFNVNHPMAKRTRARQEFFVLVKDFFEKQNFPPPLMPDFQLIPFGFTGRLNSMIRFTKTKFETLKNKTLTIVWGNDFNEFSETLYNFERYAMDKGIFLKYFFQNQSEKPNQSKIFASVQNFKGNQKDPIGSWSFLFSKNYGSLAPFKDSIKALLNRAITVQTEEEKIHLLQTIHETVLKEAMVVPFLITKTNAFHSNRVNLQAWNPFDMRLRLYEVQWQ